MAYVCTAPDLHTAQLVEAGTIWMAELSNGETVYQDDGRKDVEPESAWIRLGMYCKDNNVHITCFTIQNGTNTVQIKEDADGYFFCKGAGGFLFTSDGETYQSYIIGTLNDGLLRVHTYNVPELTLHLSENRDPAEAGECLITKQGVLSGEKQKREEQV
tara:strand:+ start:29728 stop:30204 length:477 start_codon:yes stop_codon:yes gene_type:complete